MRRCLEQIIQKRLLGLIFLVIIIILGLKTVNIASNPISLNKLHILGVDPKKVQGANTCRACHLYEYKAWEQTIHFKSPSVQGESRKLAKIAKKMGIDPDDILYEENICRECHFTLKMIRGDIHPIFGISCESCHGGAKDWYKLHNQH